MKSEIRHYDAPPVDKNEILRYMKGEASSLPLVDAALAASEGVLSYRVCYRVDPCRISASAVETPYATWESASLAASFSGCEKVIAFAATIGVGIDRLIARFGLLSPVRSLALSAVGSERIEALCDAFCRDMEQELGPLTRRFSPGYGDFPLSAQEEIFSLLTPHKAIGLTLTASGMMIPEKSVTALIGVGRGQESSHSVRE